MDGCPVNMLHSRWWGHDRERTRDTNRDCKLVYPKITERVDLLQSLIVTCLSYDHRNDRFAGCRVNMLQSRCWGHDRECARDTNRDWKLVYPKTTERVDLLGGRSQKVSIRYSLQLEHESPKDWLQLLWLEAYLTITITAGAIQLYTVVRWEDIWADTAINTR